jgi:hypothetical protein
MPEATVREKQGRLVVLACKRDHLEDITGEYYASLGDSAANPAAGRIDVADPHSAGRLDQAWYAPDHGFRWMPKRASVTMKTSGSKEQNLRLSGYAPAAALQKGPITMTVSVDGAAFPTVRIDKPDAPFQFEFPLRPALRKEIQVTVELDHTFRVPPDVRELGLAFGVFEIR